MCWKAVGEWMNYGRWDLAGVAISQCCQPWGFPANLGLFFCGVAFFFKTCGLLVFGLVLIEICLFFGLVFADICFADCFFFQISWHFSCLNLLLKAYWACFCEDLIILDLFFRICHPDSLFDFLANFLFRWIFLPTHFWLVFRLNYLFLACFSNLLACSWKITWHHCCIRRDSSRWSFVWQIMLPNISGLFWSQITLDRLAEI